MTTLPELPRVEILGYSIAACTLEQAVAWALAACREPTPKSLVTLNPEIIVQAHDDPALRVALRSAGLTVADGIGVVWAAKRKGLPLPGRVAGIDLVTHLLEDGAEQLKVYFLGARPGVAARAAAAAERRFKIAAAGEHHGYFESAETGYVVEQVRCSGANLLLAGLGAGQERFLFDHREALGVPLMIGVGGTLDVLAGEARRSPPWTRSWGIEWVWRVSLDPKRWHRLPRLLRFAWLVLGQDR